MTMAWMARGISIAGALILAGCASRPLPSLAIVATAPGTSRIDLLVATTRKPSQDDGIRFSGERASMPSFATMTVSIPPNHKTGDVLWSATSPPDAASAFAAVGFTGLDGSRMREAVRQKIRLTGRSHVLVFVHGYNTRFDEAAFRLAQIVHDSQAPVTPILFSWPSWGSLASYPYDRESAAVSRDALESLLSEAARESSVTQISVLAHSMGGWLTLETLRQIVIRNGTVHPKIGNVMLASPDIDIDVAGSLSRTLLDARHRPKMTLFVSSDDRALSASRFLWGSKDRLGSINPENEPYRSRLESGGIEVIDLTAIKSRDALNHGKFAASPPVVRVIGERLAQGQKLGGETSPGETADAALRSTVKIVGDVITAPLKVVAPQEP